MALELSAALFKYSVTTTKGKKMAEIIERELTPEEIEERAIWDAGKHEQEIEEVNAQRRGAYQAESDPIFFQAQRGDTYTLDDWKAKVAEIDERYPYPTAPKAK